MKPMIFVALVAAIGAGGSAQAKDKSSWSVQFGMSQGRLGVQVTDMTEELRDFFGAPTDAGILVSKVIPDSPAAKAGVKVGDVIVEVEGTRIEHAWDVLTATAGKKKGDRVDVLVVRKQRQVKLGAILDDDSVGPSGFQMGKGAGSFQFDLGDLSIPGLGDLDKMQSWTGSFPLDSQKLQTELEQTRKQLRELEKRLKKLEKTK